MIKLCSVGQNTVNTRLVGKTTQILREEGAVRCEAAGITNVAIINSGRVKNAAVRLAALNVQQA